MRVSIRHTTEYSYDAVGSYFVERLRLTPFDNPAQRVIAWTIEADGMEGAVHYVDGFANRVHLLAKTKAREDVTIIATGEVETVDTGGILGGLGEVANPLVFLRATPRTQSSAAIDAMADELRERPPLDRLHRLLEAIADHVVYDTNRTNGETTAADAFAAGHGVCQDHAHIFIAAARRLGVPARYVTGYLHVTAEEPASAHHAWAEAMVPDLGWVGFDPANHICPSEHYVRLACGFDAPSAAPVTGARRGGGNESLRVDVTVRQQQQ